MPKSKKTIKIDGRTIHHKNPMKLRIGTRKTGKSALAMTNDELHAVLQSNDKRKWHNRARQVLQSRGVDLS